MSNKIPPDAQILYIDRIETDAYGNETKTRIYGASNKSQSNSRNNLNKKVSAEEKKKYEKALSRYEQEFSVYKETKEKRESYLEELAKVKAEELKKEARQKHHEKMEELDRKFVELTKEKHETESALEKLGFLAFAKKKEAQEKICKLNEELEKLNLKIEEVPRKLDEEIGMTLWIAKHDKAILEEVDKKIPLPDCPIRPLPPEHMRTYIRRILDTPEDARTRAQWRTLGVYIVFERYPNCYLNAKEVSDLYYEMYEEKLHGPSSMLYSLVRANEISEVEKDGGTYYILQK